MAGIRELFDIIDADYAKHHVGRDYTAEDAKSTFLKYVAQGRIYYYTGKTIFLVDEHTDKPDTMEFHAINAGGLKDLVQGIEEMLDQAKTRFTDAVTYYDDPSLNDLGKFFKYPITFARVDEGEDRTYSATFHLRG
jgi:hypothetical protein